LVMGQCSEALHDQLESLNNWSDMLVNWDVIPSCKLFRWQCTSA
jgi:hypothetical protein